MHTDLIYLRVQADLGFADINALNQTLLCPICFFSLQHCYIALPLLTK